MVDDIQTKQFSAINSTTYQLDTYSGSNKVIETTIGDEKQTEFYPRLKIKKWDNESNFSVGIIDTWSGSGVVDVSGSKISWIKSDVIANFYPIDSIPISNSDVPEPIHQPDDGAFEFDIILQKPMIGNVLPLSIETKGFRFCYQPSLTEEERLTGSINRPINVEKSYAVFHDSKRDNQYQTGKAFHIYRPKITDSLGSYVWGDININKDVGSLYVIIPQEFLDIAIYPITIDPTFGYTSAGATTVDYNNADCFGLFLGSPTTTGSVTRLYSYITGGTASGPPPGRFNFGDFDRTGSNVSTKCTTNSVTLQASTGSWTSQIPGGFNTIFRNGSYAFWATSGDAGEPKVTSPQQYYDVDDTSISFSISVSDGANTASYTINPNLLFNNEAGTGSRHYSFYVDYSDFGSPSAGSTLLEYYSNVAGSNVISNSLVAIGSIGLKPYSTLNITRNEQVGSKDFLILAYNSLQKTVGTGSVFLQHQYTLANEIIGLIGSPTGSLAIFASSNTSSLPIPVMKKMSLGSENHQLRGEISGSPTQSLISLNSSGFSLNAIEFGSDWLYSEVGSEIITNNTTSYISHGSLSITPNTTQNYYILGYTEAASLDPRDPHKVRLSIDGSTNSLHSPVIVPGSPFNSESFFPLSFVAVQSLDTSGHTITIDHRSGSGGASATSYIRNSRILAIPHNSQNITHIIGSQTLSSHPSLSFSDGVASKYHLFFAGTDVAGVTPNLTVSSGFNLGYVGSFRSFFGSTTNTTTDSTQGSYYGFSCFGGFFPSASGSFNYALGSLSGANVTTYQNTNIYFLELKDFITPVSLSVVGSEIVFDNAYIQKTVRSVATLPSRFSTLYNLGSIIFTPNQTCSLASMRILCTGSLGTDSTVKLTVNGIDSNTVNVGQITNAAQYYKFTFSTRPTLISGSQYTMYVTPVTGSVITIVGSGDQTGWSVTERF